MKIFKIVFPMVFILSACSFCQAKSSGDVLADQSRLVQAGKVSLPSLLAKYREGMKAEPKNPLNYVLAAALYDREESTTLYQQAIALSPDYLPARIGYGRMLLRRGSGKMASEQLQKALSLDPIDRDVRVDAIRAAVRSSNLEDARTLAGADVNLKTEIVQALIDDNKLDDANKMSTTLGIKSSDAPEAVVAKGRLLYYLGQKQNKSDLREQGIRLLMEGWNRSPREVWFYKFNYPRRPLIQILSDAHRGKDLKTVIAKGIELYPQEYSLYEGLWKSLFAAVKPDYHEERKAVLDQVEELLKEHPPNPELFKTAALGFKMADKTAEADQMNQKLVDLFPYSQAAMSARRMEAVKCPDPKKKLALMGKFNADFPNMPMYPEWFKTLVALHPPDKDLLKGAEEYLQKYPYAYLAINDIGDAFVERGIYYDQLLSWMDKQGMVPKKTPSSWDVRVLATRGEVLVLQGHPKDAEALLRPLLDVKAQGLSNVDLGKVRYALGAALEKQGRQDEAVDMYAQAYAESQHYIAPAGEKFRSLYRKTRGGEKGMDEFLSIREGMYQVAAENGIERGTKINKPAPDFELSSLDGKRISLASLRGKVVILNFWATWCGPCNAELPHFEKFYERVKDDPGVAVFAITTDENRALVKPFVKEHKYTFPVLFDENVRGKFGIRGIPATFVIDPTGMIQLRMVGFNENEPLAPYLQKLVAEYRVKADGGTGK